MVCAVIRVFVGVSAALCVAAATAGESALSTGGSTAGVEFNGVTYRVEKATVDGQEIRLYYDDTRAYTPEELRAHVASQEPRILTPAVRQAVEDAEQRAALKLTGMLERGDTLGLDDLAAVGEMLDLIVVLRSQPAAPIARQQWSEVRAELDVLKEGIRAITRRSLPTQSLSPDLERQFAATPLSPADIAERRVLAEQLDDLERDVRRDIAARIALAVRPDQDELAEFVEQLGGQVTARISTMSILGVRIPASRVIELAGHELVAQIGINHPGMPELDNHRYSLGLEDGFWAAGIDGGVHDVGVLDTGVEQSHPALSSHRFMSDMGTHDTGYHGTGMAGILASTDATYRGMAYGCDMIVVSLAGWDDTSMAGMDYIASTGEPENVNYSFGNGTAYDTDYGPIDQFFDGAIDTFGYMVSKSTGNGGWGVTTITHPAPAYNLLASANMDDMNTIDRADDRITSSSSTGPTLGGRKKPDITAPGTNSRSTSVSGGFSDIGGTSSASPHTGGGIALLYDMGTTTVMAGKAVLLNTTDPMDNNGTSTTADDQYVDGSHWNARYGWGYLNLGSAYLHGLDVFVDSVPDQPEDADFRLYVGQMFAYERATLVWQRHVAHAGATYPTQIEEFSDLDLFAYRESNNNLLASSESPIDSVEQLHVESDGLVVLKVEANNTFDPDIPTEQFAVATQENFTAAAGPDPAPNLIHPDCVASSEQFTVRVHVPNNGDVAAHGVSVELSGVTIVSGANPAALGSIAAGESATATWTVQAPVDDGEYPLVAEVLSDSYGETFSASDTSIYEVGDCPCVGDLDGDGTRDLGDLAIILANYDGPGGPADGDLTGDGLVDLADLAILLSVFGVDCP